MLLQLGPFPTDDLSQWAKTARRIVCELRVDPGELSGIATTDLLDAWSMLIDTWSDAAQRMEVGSPFCWFNDVDTELAEYLLHGLDTCIHSSVVLDRLTEAEIDRQRATTMVIVQAFLDGLQSEGKCHEEYVEQVKASFGADLDH